MSSGHHWEGEVLAIKPRILLNRSFDQRWEDYLGYYLIIEAAPDDRLTVGISEEEQRIHAFRSGDRVRGYATFGTDPDHDPATYTGSGLVLVQRGQAGRLAGPPWRGVPPGLDVYQERGYRRLAIRTFAAHCVACLWSCEMAVEITIDHWNPRHKDYRRETFCFGPLSCKFYKAGPPRQVPGRKGMIYKEDDWVDEDATGHRDLDD